MTGKLVVTSTGCGGVTGLLGLLLVDASGVACVMSD